MMTIDCGDLITPDDQLKRRRGKPRNRYPYLNVETHLRSIALRIAKGELKSAYAAYKDDHSRRYREKRWHELKPTLMKGAELTLELERRDVIRIEVGEAQDSNWQFIINWLRTTQPKTTDSDRHRHRPGLSFHPDCHKIAPIGTLAWVNTGHPFYDMACRAGWSPAVGLGHGEVLIRRDMEFSLVVEFDAATLQSHLAQFAAIGCMGAPVVVS